MNAVGWALVPFSVALALDVFSAGTTRGMRTGVTLGAATFVVALAFWFGAGIVFRPAEHRKEEESEMKLEDKIVQVLTEARVVLPGAQALFGFQLAITLMESYEALPESSKSIHLASTCAIACSCSPPNTCVALRMARARRAPEI